MQVAKRQLRQLVLERVRALSPRAVEQESLTIAARVIALPRWRAARAVCVYLSTASEVDTRPLIADALERRVRLYVPHVDAGARTMHMVEMRSLDDMRTYEHHYGIAQPSAALVPHLRSALDDEGLDVVVTPCVALTRAGDRLGHGAGYYDRFFAKLTARAGASAPLKVGVALSAQLVDSLPCSETDVPVDVVATADGLHWRRGASAPALVGDAAAPSSTAAGGACSGPNDRVPSPTACRLMRDS